MTGTIALLIVITGLYLTLYWILGGTNMDRYGIEYLIGKTYKYKTVLAESPEQAIKKARLTTSVVNIQIVGEEYYTKDKYLLRDF